MRMAKVMAAIAVLLITISFVHAAEVNLDLPEKDYYEPTIVVINSNKWQDAYLTSLYANLNFMPVRYIQDPFQLRDFLTELRTHRVTKVILFSRRDNPVPSLTYQLHAMNMDVRETVFDDQHDLSAIIAKKLNAKTAIIVRDDFAFDALSAKYLAQQLQAAVMFSKGADEMDGRVLDAIKSLSPSQVFLVGTPSEKLERTLTNHNLVKLQGRDELDTNAIVNKYIVKEASLRQAILTSGEILELTTMNTRDQPIFLVPDFGTYSLPQTSDLISLSGIKVLLGIGRFISESASWLNQRNGVRVLIKFGTIRPNPEDEGMVKKDIAVRLEGYELPLPRYDGKIVEINPSYGEPLGPATASLINRDKPAPPVVFKSAFENTGNIEFPVYIILKITDENDATVATLQSERQIVSPKRANIFNVKWDNPPAEGNYRVEASVFGDVYEGLQLPGKSAQFELRWLVVLINLLLFLLAIIMLALALYASQVLSKDIKDFRIVYRKIGEEFDRMIAYLTNRYYAKSRK